MQAIIKMKGNADFYLKNIGTRAMYVNGKPVCTGEKAKLNHTAIIEVAIQSWSSVAMATVVVAVL